MWTSVPHSHASMVAAARTCPTASSATVQMATQVRGAGWAPRTGQGQIGGPGLRNFLWLMHGGWIDGDKESRKKVDVLVTAKKG